LTPPSNLVNKLVRALILLIQGEETFEAVIAALVPTTAGFG
jgi:hypothetical protein